MSDKHNSQQDLGEQAFWTDEEPVYYQEKKQGDYSNDDRRRVLGQNAPIQEVPLPPYLGELITTELPPPPPQRRMAAWKIVLLTLLSMMILSCVCAGIGACVTAQLSPDIFSLQSALSDEEWRERGLPSDEEILIHFEEKYGEEFRIVSRGGHTTALNSFFTMEAVRLPERTFNLRVVSADRLALPASEWRDSFQVVQAQALAEELMYPLLREQLGDVDFGLRASFPFHGIDRLSPEEIADNAQVFARYQYRAMTLPSDFDWCPEDGLTAFILQVDPSTIFITVTFDSVDEMNLFYLRRAKEFCERVVALQLFGSEGRFNLQAIAVDATSWSNLSCEFEDGVIANLTYSDW